MTSRATTSTAFLEALAEARVRYIFANLGSDHTGLIEALAQANAGDRAALAESSGPAGSGVSPGGRVFPRGGRVPRIIVCPHETVALSAAHAYASVSRQPQAVFVHVDAGTQNLGGAVSNAMRGRVPVLIFAGAAPFTITGELPGGRNEFIHWIQDVPDQRGILRGYAKYDNEIRTGRNVKQLGPAAAPSGLSSLLPNGLSSASPETARSCSVCRPRPSGSPGGTGRPR